MQDTRTRPPGGEDEVRGTFAERTKAARLRAGLTQQQLVDRLAAETSFKPDTSGITRIEAGQREPRLSEALAIAQVLGFGLDNLVPRADLNFYLNDIDRLMKESREALVSLARSVDPLIDYVRRRPESLDGDALEERLRSKVDEFRLREASDSVALTRTRTDEKLKRQLLRAVSDGILVKADEMPPAHERWFKNDIGDVGPQTTGRRTGWRRVDSPAPVDEWQRNFSDLLHYVDQHGDARVPRSYVTPDGSRLGAWVADQRNHFARDTLAPDKVLRLEEVPGWMWRPRGARAGGSPKTRT